MAPLVTLVFLKVEGQNLVAWGIMMCFLTLYNVCSVHRGMFSTLGGVQYIRGYHEYIRGIS